MSALNPKDKDFNVWPAFVDAFTSFFIIFLIFFVVSPERMIVSIQQNNFREILNERFADEVGREEVKLDRDGNFQEISFSSNILFARGSSRLTGRGRSVLDRLYDTLNQAAAKVRFKQIQVEGHTDSTPVGEKKRRPGYSNWELSADRAIAVIKFFEETGRRRPGELDMAIFSATGYSHHKPRDPARPDLNRRIELRIVYSVKD